MRRCPERSSAVKTRLLLLICLGCNGAALADPPKTVQSSIYLEQIANAQAMVAACTASASACDPTRLPDPEHVEDRPGAGYRVSWQWLRDEIAAAKTGKPAERSAKMKAAQAHLAALAVQAGTGLLPSPDGFVQARKAANVVLARPEFRTSVEGPTWTERQLARLQDWILRLFSGMDRVGRRAPWLAPLIEWGCFALAVAGLLWFVRQNLARQALRIALSEGVALAGRGERDSADWARMAQERAAAQDWREAVHCLYWAAIALLEGRRAWRPNATRTPREYLKLLKPGSEAHRALRDLTRSFERIWYGHDIAGEQQYRASLDSYHALEASKAERAAVPGEPDPGAALPTMGGA